MILARLAMGLGWLPPCAANTPTPAVPTTASARPGQPGRGGTPGRTRSRTARPVIVIAGTGRINCTTTKTTAAITRTATTANSSPATCRRRNLLPAPPRGPPPVTGWKMPPSHRPARDLARNRSRLRGMTHHQNNNSPTGASRPRQSPRTGGRALSQTVKPCYRPAQRISGRITGHPRTPRDEVTRRQPHLAAMPITTVRNDAPQCSAGDPAIRLVGDVPTTDDATYPTPARTERMLGTAQRRFPGQRKARQNGGSASAQPDPMRHSALPQNGRVRLRFGSLRRFAGD